jgi:xyloglucan fucosyltransferase
MRQREAKVGVDSAAAPPWKEQQQSTAAGRWLDTEAAAALGFTPRTKRAPCCSVINMVLAAFVLTVPTMVILLGARTSVPAVRISSADDAVRRGGRL